MWSKIDVQLIYNRCTIFTWWIIKLPKGIEGEIRVHKDFGSLWNVLVSNHLAATRNTLATHLSVWVNVNARIRVQWWPNFSVGQPAERNTGGIAHVLRPDLQPQMVCFYDNPPLACGGGRWGASSAHSWPVGCGGAVNTVLPHQHPEKERWGTETEEDKCSERRCETERWLS